MNKTTKFIFISLWIFLSRSYDAYSTYNFTPDLSKEANPLVTILNLNWSPLIITLLILFVWVIYCYYKATFTSYNLNPNKKGYNFSNFVGYVYIGKKQKWISTLYKLPNSINRFNLIIGNLISRCLVFAGIVSTSMWLLINNTDFYKEIHNAYLIYSILIIGSFFICRKWFLNGFKKYNTTTNNV